MTDKNGIEIKTGMIVEITGAYFKSDNGFYFVAAAPGDPGWYGRDYSLRKISKRGKVSTAKNSIGFWPIFVTVGGAFKAAEARNWNREHAAIEVKAIENMAEVAGYFREKAAGLVEQINRLAWDFGEGSPVVADHRKIAAFYEAVAQSIEA